jgi:hypothetical protein
LDLYSLWHGNEDSSSTLGDVDRHVITRKFLESTSYIECDSKLLSGFPWLIISNLTCYEKARLLKLFCIQN